MAIKSTSRIPAPEYDRIARALHWAMAIVMIPLLLLGQQTMGSHNARWLPTVHASLGLVLVLLFGVRVFWRLNHPPPANENGSPLERLVARGAHILLYCAMFLIPFTGWLAYTEHVKRSLGMRPASWFGFRIPLLPDLGIDWHRIHNWGGKLVLLLIILHVVAALKHHFYDKDNTLDRMLP